MSADASQRIPRKSLPARDVQCEFVSPMSNAGQLVGTSQPTNSPELPAKPQGTAAHSLEHQNHPLLPGEGQEASVNEKKPKFQEYGHSSYHHVAPKCKDVLNRSWLWESISCVAVLALLCAIIAVLVIYDNKPLPQLPFRISLNAIISLLATALKGSLLIPTAACISQLKWNWYRKTRALSDVVTWDEASRGPWGALMLLCSPSLFDLATLGAVLTILTVVLDPFTQQIIRYRPCLSVSPGLTASVSRTQNYSLAGLLATTGSQPYQVMMDIEMEAAIYRGAYGSPSDTQSLLSRCETGNCTFPGSNDIAYQSLGICQKCVDVSSAIILFCNDKILSNNHTYTTCNYTLPLQPNMTSALLPKINDSSVLGPTLPKSQYWQGSHVMQVAAEYTAAQGLGYVDPHYHPYPGIELIDANSIGKFAYISYSFYGNESAEDTDSPVNNNHTIAVECGLYPCIQSYSASVNNSLLRETIVHQQFLEWPNLPYVDLDAAASPCIIDGQPINTDDITIDYQNVLASHTALGIKDGSPDITNNTTETSHCLYHLHRNSLSAFNLFFRTMFTGDIYGYAAGSVSGSNLAGPSSDWLSMLWRKGNNSISTTNATMASIAQSMTDHMRLNDRRNNSARTDQVWLSQTCVRVEWAWLTLHAVLVALCFVFLALTVMMSAKHARGRIWKSSPLALMYHGLEGQIADKVGMIDGIDGIEERARRLKVHVGYTEQGWRFVESTST